MSRKHKYISVAVVGALVTGGGIAAAMWSGSGSGAGQAKALSSQSVSVTAATGTADLYPGNVNGDVFFTLNNTNPFGINFTSMTPGTITTSSAGCPASNISVAAATGLNILVPANTVTTSTLSIPDVVSMSTGAPDACQGVTFTINLTLSGQQV
jgi:hypothetical protein